MDLDRIFTRLNGAIVWTLRSPLHALLDPGLLLLTITGRRSGRRYTIPVGYQKDGERIVVLVSKARRKQWWRNYRSSGAIDVHHRGRTRRGSALALEAGSPAFVRAFELTLQKMPWLGRQFGIDYRRRDGITPAQREVLAREAAAITIDLA